MKWYKRAAFKDNPAAISNIGNLYWTGKGVRKNTNRAIQYYIMAAERTHPRAQYFLAEAYLDGKGISKDTAKAVELYRKAAENGEPLAMDTLSHIYFAGLYGQERDKVQGQKWLDEAKRVRKEKGIKDPEKMTWGDILKARMEQ